MDNISFKAQVPVLEVITTYRDFNKNHPNLKRAAQLFNTVWVVGFNCEFNYDVCVIIFLDILSKIVSACYMYT